MSQYRRRFHKWCLYWDILVSWGHFNFYSVLHWILCPSSLFMEELIAYHMIFSIWSHLLLWFHCALCFVASVHYQLLQVNVVSIREKQTLMKPVVMGWSANMLDCAEKTNGYNQLWWVTLTIFNIGENNKEATTITEMGINIIHLMQPFVVELPLYIC